MCGKYAIHFAKKKIIKFLGFLKKNCIKNNTFVYITFTVKQT